MNLGKKKAKNAANFWWKEDFRPGAETQVKESKKWRKIRLFVLIYLPGRLIMLFGNQACL